MKMAEKGELERMKKEREDGDKVKEKKSYKKYCLTREFPPPKQMSKRKSQISLLRKFKKKFKWKTKL